MKKIPWLFQSFQAQCRWFDLAVIWMIAALIGSLGILYSYCWVTWVFGLDKHHARHWLDPYDIIGFPIIIFAFGMIFLRRVIVLLFAIFALIVALFFIVMMMSYGGLPNTLIIAALSLLIGIRLIYVSCTKAKVI
ncbi:MAG: hypothetical protein WCP60_03900 [bacterium]